MRSIHFVLWFRILLLFCLSLSAYAETPTFILDTKHPWSLEIGLGYGQYEHIGSSCGSAALGRIGIGKELFQWKRIRAGLETAFQTGTTASVHIPPDSAESMGGLPVDSTFQSTLDFLLTGKFYPYAESSAYTLAKCGIILRKWHFDNRSSIPNLTRYDPELMIGGGYDLTSMASLSLSYQRIQGGSPTFNCDGDCTTGSFANIPSENALILGLSIYFI